MHRFVLEYRFLFFFNGVLARTHGEAMNRDEENKSLIWGFGTRARSVWGRRDGEQGGTRCFPLTLGRAGVIPIELNMKTIKCKGEDDPSCNLIISSIRFSSKSHIT